MDLDRISEMVAALCGSHTVTELTLREGATRLTLRRALAASAGRAADGPPPSLHQPEPYIVRSPLVGTFHCLLGEGQTPVAAGTAVQVGQVLGAIESMRILYDVAADAAGVVSEVLVEEGQPVEYGQELFRIQPPESGEGAP
ncbi:MAG: biotin/lipoyl-binding protein [Armatimonadetes bacterium]|nr:biotin/lipoyl-binding protein [Armatimonadota bacterium]